MGHVKSHANFHYIAVLMVCNTFICFLTQDPLVHLYFHLQATQEACLWDIIIYSSPVPSSIASQLVVPILSSTSLATIQCQISLLH